MSITGIVIATVIVGGVGIFIGLFLGAAGEKFAVEVDEKEVAVRECLPGNNCGGCGFPGCAGLAAAIAKGEAQVNACPVGGDAVGKQIAAIMGVESRQSVRMTAFVSLYGRLRPDLSALYIYRNRRLPYAKLCAQWRSQILYLWLSWLWHLCKGVSF